MDGTVRNPNLPKKNESGKKRRKNDKKTEHSEKTELDQ
jgi:hypothetical protein